MFYKARDPSATSVDTIFTDVELPRYTNGFSFGVWSQHHAAVIVAISAQFTFKISDCSVIFGTTDLMFVFTTKGRSHFPHMTCILWLPRDWRLDQRCQTRSYFD